MADDKPYNDKHVKAYNGMLGAVPIDKTIETRELYDSARIDALSTIKGKRAKSYEHGIELLTDALIKFRKSSKHPHASEDKEHRHHYAGEIRAFLEQYAKSNKMDAEGVEKLIKSGKLRSVLETLLTTEEARHEESKLDYEMRRLLPEKAEDYKGVAEYHLSQNPEFKKSLSKAKLARFKTDRETLLDYLKDHYRQTIENKLNDFNVPEKKDPKKK
jgi:hypothetical protein